MGWQVVVVADVELGIWSVLGVPKTLMAGKPSLARLTAVALPKESSLMNFAYEKTNSLVVVGLNTCVKFTRYTLAVSDRKSTRLNSSHLGISYAVFCLKKKN